MSSTFNLLAFGGLVHFVRLCQTKLLLKTDKMSEEDTFRTLLDYENLSQKFLDPSPDYNKQYCSVYLVRLKQMEDLLMERIKAKWSDTYPICKLHKLTETNYSKCVVIGTLFKDQKLKPSVLKQLAEGHQLNPQPIRSHFTDDSDVLHIEDEIQRYQIIGLSGKELVTGISIALLGTDNGKGKFIVEDHTFAGFRKQIPRPLSKETSYVVFLSGLDLVNEQNFLPNLELFSHWISGLLGDAQHDIRKITRVIIAGNSVRNTPEATKPTISMTSRITQSNETLEAVKSFDSFLLQLCEVIDVDVMPGEYDPSNHILPQKPMHFCMFPQSSVYKTLNQVTNPYHCNLGGIKLFGTSGQPVKDILSYSDIGTSLEALEKCLEWNHWAPTAPDTLGCYPFYDKDPFVVEDCPHVVFAGNQKEFATKVVKGAEGQAVRLISVPEFSATFQAIVLDLKSLECHSVVFNTIQ